MRHPIFDFDGTILDSLSGGPALFLSVAETLGLNCDADKEQQLRAQWGLPVERVVSTCWPEVNFSVFFKNLKIREAGNLHPLFPMMSDLLVTLGRDRVVSILTSRQRESMAMHLRHHNIERHIRFCSPVEDHPKPKPDPESIVPLLAQYASHGIRASSLVLIGDSVHSDFGLASNLWAMGIDIAFVAVTWGASSRFEFLKIGVPRERIADSVEQLAALLSLK